MIGFFIYNHLYRSIGNYGAEFFARFLHIQTSTCNSSTNNFGVRCYLRFRQIFKLSSLKPHVFLQKTPTVFDIYIRLPRHSQKIFGKVNCGGGRLPQYFIFLSHSLSFFVTSSYPLFCPQAFYLLLGLKRATRRLVREMMAALFSMV